jgi:hypothetical protein
MMWLIKPKKYNNNKKTISGNVPKNYYYYYYSIYLFVFIDKKLTILYSIIRKLGE